MRIAILGAGVMGSALATRFSRSGHDVVIGSRLGEITYARAVARAAVVFLAIPWPYGLAAIDKLHDDLKDRIVVDVSNPESEDARSLTIGHTTSGAEQIAMRIPEVPVVKAFSHFYAELLRDDVPFGAKPSVLYCGDDADAKRITGAIIESAQLDAVDAGPLRVARYLEPFAMLTVQLVREQGWGPSGIAWKVMRPVRDLSRS